jgi:DNA polymerase bacteriophage-type
MALANTLGISGSLGQVGERLGIPEDKRKFMDGRRLIKLFCSPPYHDRATDPVDWDRFIGYCVQDVNAEVSIFNRMRQYLPMTSPQSERAIWLLDQKINRRGLPVDRPLVDACCQIVEQDAEKNTGLLKLLTGVHNPGSVQQLKTWVEDQIGVGLPSLDKEAVDGLLADPALPPKVAQALRLRQRLARSSTAKFKAFSTRTSKDNRFRGGYAYFKAHTGRWAGTNKVQAQNLSGSSLGGETPAEIQKTLQDAIQCAMTGDLDWVGSMYPSVPALMSSLVRPVICAPPGRKLVVVDLTSIETIVLAWLAECNRILDVYRSGRDLYRVFASTVFRVPYDQVTKAQRKFAKPPILGCGFGLGGPGLKSYAGNFGVELSEAQSQKLVDLYRNTYPEIPEWWTLLKNAAIGATRNSLPKDREARRVVYCRERAFLMCALPSGRSLAYAEPSINVRGGLSYKGVHTGRWVDIETHGGKLAENNTQAVARDILAHGLLCADRAGLDIVGHTHDEIIVEADEGDDTVLPTLIKCMTTRPVWADGMPLFAEGWEGKRYCKA